jgi:hypothetical protein
MTTPSRPPSTDDTANRPAPGVASVHADEHGGGADIEYVRQVGTYLYYLNLALIANVVSAALFFAAPDLQDIVLLVGLAVIVGAAGLAVLLARMMYGTAWAIVCALPMLVPGVNVIVMLVLNRRATRLVRDAGFTVGLLGPNPEEIR